MTIDAALIDGLVVCTRLTVEPGTWPITSRTLGEIDPRWLAMRLLSDAGAVPMEGTPGAYMPDAAAAWDALASLPKRRRVTPARLAEVAAAYRLGGAQVVARDCSVSPASAYRLVRAARDAGVLGDDERPGEERVMSGSVKRDTERGTWFFVVDVPGPDGQRRQLKRRGFATREGSCSRVGGGGRGLSPRKVRRPDAIDAGNVSSPSSWLPMIGQRVRPTTLDGYRRAVTNHVLPDLGAIALGQLNRATVATWVSELSGRGLAPKTVRNVVGRVDQDPRRRPASLDLSTSNVAQRLRNLPAASPPRPRAWTIVQAQRFIAHVRDDRWYPLWRFYAVTGVRRGEALGLRWDDVDLEAATVTIRHQRTIAGGSVVEGPPKTNSGARTIAVDATMVAALRAWRRQPSRGTAGDGRRLAGRRLGVLLADRRAAVAADSRLRGSASTAGRSVCRRSACTVCGTRRRRG